MAALSQGSSFSFAGANYTATRISVNLQWDGNNRQRISTAHLGTSIDVEEPYVFGFLPRADESASTVEVEFMGGSVIAVGTTGGVSVTFNGGGSFSATGTCVSSVTTAATGDLIRGTATFRVKPT